MFSAANLVTLWKDASEVGYLYGLDRKCKSLAHWAYSVSTSCALSMLSGVYVWSHDQLTHGLVQYCGKIMKICIPSYSFHYRMKIKKFNNNFEMIEIESFQILKKFKQTWMGITQPWKCSFST